MSQFLVLIVVIIVLLYLMGCECNKESFYDWQTLGVNSGVNEYSKPIGINGHSDCRTPRYQHHHDHSMFININTDNVGCGSCIYNKLDPNFDGVLPDWQWTLQNYGRTIWKSPPLDSEIFTVPEGYEKCSTCQK